MSKSEPDEVALLAPSDTASPGQSPVLLHHIIIGNVTATDISTAWNGGREIGWVYRGSDGNSYWQPNYLYETPTSISVSAGIGIGVGYTTSSDTGDILKLDGHRPILEQLPHGTQLLPGFDHTRKQADVHEGATYQHSPIGKDFQIPNGTSEGTNVVDINSIKAGTLTVGWVYRGSDGYNYYQRNWANRPPLIGSIQLGPVSYSKNAPAVSDIHRYRESDLLPGEHLISEENPEAPTLDRDGGLDGPGPRHQVKDGPGMSGRAVHTGNHKETQTSRLDHTPTQPRNHDPNLPFPYTKEIAHEVKLIKRENHELSSFLGAPTLSVESHGSNTEHSSVNLTGRISMDEENIYHHTSTGDVGILDRIEVLALAKDPERMNAALNQAHTSQQQVAMSFSHGDISLGLAASRDRGLDRSFGRF